MGAAVVFLAACGNSKPAQNSAQTQQTQESSQQTSFPEVSFAPPSYRADYGYKTVSVTVGKLTDGYEPGVDTASGEAGPAKSSTVASSRTSPSMPAESLWYTDSGATSGTGTSSSGGYVSTSGSSGSSGSTPGEGFHPFHGLTEPGTNIPVYPNGFSGSSSSVAYRCPNPDIYTPASADCRPSQPFHGLYDE